MLFVYKCQAIKGTYRRAVASVEADSEELARMAVEDSLKGTDWQIEADDFYVSNPKVYESLVPHLEEFII